MGTALDRGARRGEIDALEHVQGKWGQTRHEFAVTRRQHEVRARTGGRRPAGQRAGHGVERHPVRQVLGREHERVAVGIDRLRFEVPGLADEHVQRRQTADGRQSVGLVDLDRERGEAAVVLPVVDDDHDALDRAEVVRARGPGHDAARRIDAHPGRCVLQGGHDRITLRVGDEWHELPDLTDRRARGRHTADERRHVDRDRARSGLLLRRLRVELFVDLFLERLLLLDLLGLSLFERFLLFLSGGLFLLGSRFRFLFPFGFLFLLGSRFRFLFPFGFLFLLGSRHLCLFGCR